MAQVILSQILDRVRMIQEEAVRGLLSKSIEDKDLHFAKILELIYSKEKYEDIIKVLKELKGEPNV